MNSLQKIHNAFKNNKTAFMPYFTVGYPSNKESLDIIESCVKNGADLLELGMSFSDPLADGPTIQNSTQIALQNGASVISCLESVKELRNREISIPLILMGYINPIIAYGIKKFVIDAKNAGADGFIIPDLPPDEASKFLEICRNENMALIFLISPNSTSDRIKQIVKISTGFIYLVSVIGITGERNKIPVDLKEFYKKIKSLSNKPIAVGFGISSPNHAQIIGEFADGVIVGSSLIKAVTQAVDKPKVAGEFVASYKSALTNFIGDEIK